jgi:hypothetical protein
MAHASGGHVQPGYAVLTQAIQVPVKTRSIYFITLMMPVHVPHLIVALSTKHLCMISPESWELQNPALNMMIIILYVDKFVYTSAYKYSLIIQLGKLP